MKTARINLGYATITAPISGRARQMRVLEGALVGQGEATLLTTVEQVDPIFVFFDQPAADFERLQRAQASGAVTLAQGNLAEVRLVRADGTLYDEKGTLDFSDYSVNPTTGAVAFRGRVANPGRVLLPGMFVNVRLTVGTLNKGFRVPQLAVQRDGQGPYVLVVGADGKVAQKRVETAAAVDNDWVISSGLADGDQVIVVRPAEGAAGLPARRSGGPGAGSEPAAAPRSRKTGRSASPLPPLVPARAHSMAQFFIDRPVFAWVIAILITLGGVLRHPQAAGGSLSGRRAAAGVHQRDVPRRQRRHGRAHGHPGHRAAAHRHRQPDVLLVVGVERRRQHHAGVRDRHGSGHRRRADAEPRRAGRTAPAARSGAAGPAGRRR